MVPILQLEVSAMLIDCLYVLGVYAVFGSISAILPHQQDFGRQTLFFYIHFNRA
jgi:hypothetical protein